MHMHPQAREFSTGKKQPTSVCFDSHMHAEVAVGAVGKETQSGMLILVDVESKVYGL